MSGLGISQELAAGKAEEGKEKDIKDIEEKSSKESKQQPQIVNPQEGTYIIRCFLNDFSRLCYISGPTNVNLSPQPSMHAIAKNIDRTMRTERVRERDLPQECFVEVIHRKNGIILLRQYGTNRYATFNEGKRKEDDPKISFFAFINIDAPGKVAEFKLIAPTGNEADGVAILSMNNECYVEIRESSEINYLYPICKFEKISANGLFKFEQSVGLNRVLDEEQERHYPNLQEADEKASKESKPADVNLSDGEYFIRCNVANPDQSFLWLISGPTATQTGDDIHARGRKICRDTRTKKIRERDLAPECFVRVINLKDGNGTILLRQSGTDRYATVFREQDEDPPKIVFRSLSPDNIGEDPKFQLIAPNGNEADGVAIRAVANNCYVGVDMEISGSNYLYPICKFGKISANGLFKFELRENNPDRVLNGEKDLDYANEDNDNDQEDGGANG